MKKIAPYAILIITGFLSFVAAPTWGNWDYDAQGMEGFIVIIIYAFWFIYFLIISVVAFLLKVKKNNNKGMNTLLGCIAIFFLFSIINRWSYNNTKEQWQQEREKEIQIQKEKDLDDFKKDSLNPYLLMKMAHHAGYGTKERRTYIEKAIQQDTNDIYNYLELIRDLKHSPKDIENDENEIIKICETLLNRDTISNKFRIEWDSELEKHIVLGVIPSERRIYNDSLNRKQLLLFISEVNNKIDKRKNPSKTN